MPASVRSRRGRRDRTARRSPSPPPDAPADQSRPLPPRAVADATPWIAADRHQTSAHRRHADRRVPASVSPGSVSSQTNGRRRQAWRAALAVHLLSAGCLLGVLGSGPHGRVHHVQIGVVYPQIELGGDPTAVGRFGRAVEELGFDYLLAYDHVLGAVHAGRTPPLTGPYTERDPFHDPFVMFAYLAGLTERIEFATGVLILPQRQAGLVARRAADVALLSRGRLRLGVGVGWRPVAYQALGQDFRSRGARQEEQIELLRRLFTEPVVDFAGRFDRVDRAALVPKPTRSVPIWLGGSSEVAFERAARLADGFIFFGGDIDQTVEAWNRLR